MPRTLLTPVTAVSDTFETPSFGAVDNTNGNYIAAGRAKGTLFLHFKNGNASPATVTIKAGVGGDAGLGWRAAKGDLSVSVPATTGERRVYIRDFARFLQADGTINIDCSVATVTVQALFIRD